ncbi:MAG: tetratricopeptide repeat protein, partial [Pseudomonadota bacterium]
FKQGEAIFNQAIDLPPAERAEFLERACKDDPDLRKEVEAWLAADESPTGDTMPDYSAVEGGLDILLGSRVGAYEIQKKIGEGGMGAVYLAERADDEFEQTVAIKFLTLGLLLGAGKRRFFSERQILAGLNHPNIARLLDGGTTEAGVPYLVMELVEGQTIHDYCRQHELNTAERLRLFQKVCSAVQYAHQNLVIHRDIKASNILVGKDGEPKLLDFGIAKLSDPGASSGAAPVTQADMRMLTPESASPEQIKGERITTATDVYALGLLLFRLLTGRFPYHVDGNTPQQFYRAILETDPDRPSTIVAKADDQRTDIRDDLSPQRLSKELRGDLDTIVLATLRKEPERRYATVRQLSEDVGNYLDDKPVMARSDSWSYRSSKFFRRHRLGVAASVAALAVIVSLVTFYTLQLTEERNIAQRERDTAEQVSDFIVDIFRVSDPSESRGNSITAREVLARGAATIDTSLAAQPLVKARVSSVLSEVHYGLGLYPEAAQFAEQASALQLANNPGRPELAASAQELLGNARVYLGELEPASTAFEQALAIRTETLGPEHPQTLNTMANLGDTLKRLGRVDEGEALCSAAFEKHQQVEDVVIRSWIMACHAGNLDNQADYTGAESLLREVADMQLTEFGAEDPGYLNTMNDLANALSNQSRHDEAIAIYDEVLATRERVLGPKHRHVLEVLINRGWDYHNNGNYDAAEADVGRAMGLVNEGIDDNGIWRAHALRLQGAVALMRGRFDEAEGMLLEAIELGSKVLLRPHIEIVAASRSLGALYTSQRRLDEAERFFRQSLEETEQIYGQLHQSTIGANVMLAGLQMAREQHTAALARLDEAVTGARALDNPTLEMDIQFVRFQALEKLERYEEVIEAINATRPTASDFYGADSLQIGVLALTQGNAAFGLGQYQESVDQHEQGLRIFKITVGEGHPVTSRSRLALAKAHKSLGNDDMARPLVEEAIARLTGALSPDHPTVVEAEALLASLE